MIRTEPIPVRRAGLYLRDTWVLRLQQLALAALMLCFAAPLLGVTIMCIMLAIAAVIHNYITWGLAGDLLLAVVAGAGTIVFGRGFTEAAWAAIKLLPAEYPEELASGAIHR